MIELLHTIQKEYLAYCIKVELYDSFDVWAWNNPEIGEFLYHFIHQKYGSWDDAIDILKL